MAIVFIPKPIDLTPGTLAKSGDVNLLLNAVQSNLTGVAGPGISRSFKAPVAEAATDFTMTQLAAARALKTAYFDASGNLFASNTALADFDMGGFKFSGLPTPVNPTDGVPFGFLASYSSSLAGVPNVAGKSTSVLTTDGTSPSWTTGSQNIKLGNVTTGTWNAGAVTSSGLISSIASTGTVGINSYVAGNGYSLTTDGVNSVFIVNAGFALHYAPTAFGHIFNTGGNAQLQVLDTPSATRSVVVRGGTASTNARISASSNNLAVGTTAVFDSQGSIGDETVSSVVILANSGTASIQHIDASRAANNRRHEMTCFLGTLNFRFLADNFSASTSWLSVSGGYAAGITGIAFNGPISNTKPIGFTAEFDNGNSGAAKTIALSAQQSQRVTLTANTTLTLNSIPFVGHFHLKLIQDATGSRTVAWSGFNATECPGNVFPTISTVANGVTFLTFYYDGSQLWCKGSQPMD